MNLPDDLAEWRDEFLAEIGITLDDLDSDGVSGPVDIFEATAKRIPARYGSALISDPGVRKWLGAVVRHAIATRRVVVSVIQGPSLLLLGPTGTGKTHEAFGAIRGIAACGIRSRWVAISAADFYAKMRPRHGVDAEAEFSNVASAGLLVIDDLGAAKGSEWVEELNYRLVNHRYEHALPTLFTSNIPPPKLAEALGERVASRLTEMTVRVVLKGSDRRYGDAA
jgi:DNA replication protein DnaC